MGWLKHLLGGPERPSPRDPPPPPDTSASGARLDEAEVEVCYSHGKSYRAVITRDARGLFRVHEERWDIGDWEVAGAAYWSDSDRSATITDTLENARTLATEALAGIGDTTIR